jgi:hypothetical protein
MTKRFFLKPGKAHVFCEHPSPVDESAFNSKPKSFRQVGRNLLNVGHKDLANHRLTPDEESFCISRQPRLGLIGCTLGPIHSRWDHLGTKTPRFIASFGRLSSARTTESSGFMVGAVGIEPMSQARKGCDPTHCFSAVASLSRFVEIHRTQFRL